MPRRGVFWCPRVAQLCCWGDVLGALPTGPAGPCLKPLVPTQTRTVVRTSCLVRECQRPARADIMAGSVVFPDPDSRLHGGSLCAKLFWARLTRSEGLPGVEDRQCQGLCPDTQAGQGPRRAGEQCPPPQPLTSGGRTPRLCLPPPPPRVTTRSPLCNCLCCLDLQIVLKPA